MANTVSLIVQAGRRARVDTPMVVELGDAAKGKTRACLTETDTGRTLPCQLDGTRLLFVLPGMGANTQRKLQVALGAESAPAAAVKLSDGAANGLAIEINGKPFATYRYLPEGEFPIKARPFFNPVHGAGGIVMTRWFPNRKDVPDEQQDHVHHRGLLVAYGDVNGTDNWSEEKGHGYQTHKEFSEVVSGPVCGRFTEELDWESNDHKKICEETRVFTVWNMPDDGRIADLSVTFRASDGPVKFGDTKEGGIVSLRVPSSMIGQKTGTIENAAGGIGEGETWGKSAHWVDYHGIVEGQRVGVAIMDHPFNLRHPTPWHVRDYGLFAANPFAHSHYKFSLLKNGDYTLPGGESLTFRYRIYFHRGDPRQGEVSSKWSDYAFPPVVKVDEKAGAGA